MKTEQISVPHFEGFKCLGYFVPKAKQYIWSMGQIPTQISFDYTDTKHLVYKKLPPKRYIFEETGERRKAIHREYYLNRDGDIICHDNLKDTVGIYTILRRIDE